MGHPSEPAVGSVVLDSGGRAWVREGGHANPGWVCTHDNDVHSWVALCRWFGPVKVLHRGNGASPDWVMGAKR